MPAAPIASSVRPADVLGLARRDRAQALAAVAALPIESQVALVCDTPLARRVEILELLPSPERVVPLLPEAELCFTAKQIGLADADWLLECATPEQIQACLDLDAWRADAPDRGAFEAWLEALSEVNDEQIVQLTESLDPELLVLWIQQRAEVVLKPSDDDWEPPTGASTIEGQFFLVPRRPGDDLGTLLRVLRTIFEIDYWRYFRLLQGAIWELETETEEYALRWRNGRLLDLGFPEWDEAMAIYGRLRPDELGALPEEPHALDVAEFHLPVWIPELPARADAGPLVFRAAAALDEPERAAFFYAFVGLANKVAVADRLPLGDAESIPKAIEKAAEMTSRGLEHLAAEHGLAPPDVLRRIRLERLFRVGTSLDPAKEPRVASRP
jgi:hypothetical protein